MVIKVLCFSTISMSSIVVNPQESECFLIYNHLQPPDVAAFWRVEVIISWVIYFDMKGMYSLLQV